MKQARPERQGGSRALALMGGLLLFWPPGISLPAETNSLLPYSVRRWQTDDGLPQNSVHAIAQTREGYLWVGTHEGLARFDGLRFTLVEDKDFPELAHGWITALCVSSDGSLWIACDGYGLTRLKEGVFSHFSEADGLASNQTRCLLEGKDGSLWIGSEGGLTRYKDGKFTSFTEKHGLGDSSVKSICEDHLGIIRAATKRGLSSLDPAGGIRTLHFGLGSIANALRSVCEDDQGRLWIGSNDGLHCLQDEQRLAYGASAGLPDKVMNVVYQDRRGQLWVGTYSGLARMAGGKAVTGPKSEPVFGELINALFEDREGNLWVGARDGLYRLNPARFTTYAIPQGLTCDNVMSVCEDRAGTIWLGTWGGGLNQLRGGEISSYAATNGLAHDMVLSLFEGGEGSLWIGMDFDGGLNRLKDGHFDWFSKRNGLMDAAIRVIREDGRGALWLGTSKGLINFKGGKCKVYNTTNGLPGNTVLALCEAGEGSFWIGTEGGLARWQAGKFGTFTTREGLSHNVVDALCLDGAHTLWIGTRGGGLNRFADGKFTACTTKQGLFSDEVYEIVEDDFGYFWMSCRKGLFRVSKRELEELARGARAAVTCCSFGQPDGLVSVQCNGVAKPAGWKGRDGRLWFPTIRGVVAVQPAIKTNDQPPPVVIEEVIADKTRVIGSVTKWISQSRLRTDAPMRSLTIPPGRGELEIHYTALSFQAPEKNRFKYKLEGTDTGWFEAGPRRTAYYNSIAPGTYHFRVAACNNDGVWNEEGTVLALVLLPHYWQTWWFKLAVLAGFGLALAALYRVRVARLRALERLRIQIAADLHDDVGARLTKVAMVTELVDRDTRETDPSKAHIQNISRTTREIIQAMDEIVWTINPKNDTLENLANYIFRHAQEYFQDTGVRCRLDLPAGLPDHAMSTEGRHNLFMAVKEALNNVLKHANATEVRIGLAVADGRLTITIVDNGRGFRVEEAQAAGNGLSNMKRRLERIGGRLELESQPGSGTKITMEARAG